MDIIAEDVSAKLITHEIAYAAVREALIAAIHLILQPRTSPSCLAMGRIRRTASP